MFQSLDQGRQLSIYSSMTLKGTTVSNLWGFQFQRHKLSRCERNKDVREQQKGCQDAFYGKKLGRERERESSHLLLTFVFYNLWLLEFASEKKKKRGEEDDHHLVIDSCDSKENNPAKLSTLTLSLSLLFQHQDQFDIELQKRRKLKERWWWHATCKQTTTSWRNELKTSWMTWFTLTFKSDSCCSTLLLHFFFLFTSYQKLRTKNFVPEKKSHLHFPSASLPSSSRLLPLLLMKTWTWLIISHKNKTHKKDRMNNAKHTLIDLAILTHLICKHWLKRYCFPLITYVLIRTFPLSMTLLESTGEFSHLLGRWLLCLFHIRNMGQYHEVIQEWQVQNQLFRCKLSSKK